MLVGKVKEIMEAKGKTIAALSQDTGLAMETIKRARDARVGQCRLSTLEAIAKALGVKVTDLFEEKD